VGKKYVVVFFPWAQAHFQVHMKDDNVLVLHCKSAGVFYMIYAKEQRWFGQSCGSICAGKKCSHAAFPMQWLVLEIRRYMRMCFTCALLVWRVTCGRLDDLLEIFLSSQSPVWCIQFQGSNSVAHKTDTLFHLWLIGVSHLQPFNNGT
jgi:hypothetical protein